MSFSNTLTREWNDESGAALSDQETITAGGKFDLSESIPGASTDLPVTLALDVSALVAFYIKSSRDITLETNSGSAPGNTLSLKAGKALIWSLNCGLANPLTVDVTGLFCTTEAGVAANLEARFRFDPTP
jgi:hypothetical protein